MNTQPQIYWTNDVTTRYGVKFLVYSRSGIGKTTLISTAPKPFVLSSENGLLSLRKFRLPYAEIKQVTDLDYWFNYFAQRKDNNNVLTVCVDSITDIADAVIRRELNSNKDGRKAYGEMYQAIMDRFLKFRDLMYRHVYFVAQQEPTKDEVTGAVTFGPAFPGTKLGIKSPYLFDETFQLVIAQDGSRWLRTQADWQNEAKDRSGSLAQYEPANLGAIINKIMSSGA